MTLFAEKRLELAQKRRSAKSDLPVGVLIVIAPVKSKVIGAKINAPKTPFNAAVGNVVGGVFDG